MEEFVRQVLSDLQAARRTGKQYNRNSFTILEDSIEDLDMYFGAPREQILSEIIGISSKNFPSVGQLNHRQMLKIITSFESCLLSWNILVELPKSFPIDKKYELLISTLNRKVGLLKFGYVHLEFCEQDVDKCPLGPSYCNCLHYFNDLNQPFNEGEEEET